MNKRERILLFTLLGLMIVVGGWAMYYFFYSTPMEGVERRLAQAQADIGVREQELQSSNAEMENILKRNPHLRLWPKLSLPEAKLPPGKTKMPEEAAKLHVTQVQVKYVRYLSDLLLDNGFAPASLTVAAKPVDNKSSPTIAGKGPIYNRLSFSVQGQATLAAVVRVFKHFHEDNLLQEVHTLSLTKPQTTRQGAKPDDLDVNMTIEALLVTGAEVRTDLKPTLADKMPAVSVLSDRNFDDILKKNFFIGNPVVLTAQQNLKEDPHQVLGEVRLTMVSFNGRRWQASLYDQGKGGVETPLNTTSFTDFRVDDKYKNEVLSGKVVLIAERTVVFQSNGKYYKMLCGDYLNQATEKALKDDEIKALGLTPPGKTADETEKKSTAEPEKKAGGETEKAAVPPPPAVSPD